MQNKVDDVLNKYEGVFDNKYEGVLNKYKGVFDNKYKGLFENKFTYTHKKQSGFLENLYYSISAATYNEKILFRELNRLCAGKKNLKIIDLGCGGGHEELTKYGEVYGVDISSTSLDNARSIYHEAKECDLTGHIDYPDEMFDVAFCSEVFGHIDYGDKEKYLREVARIIKDGGYILFSVETKGDNWLTRLLVKKGLYDEYWINYQGHIGLETPEVTIYRFNKIFKVKNVLPTSKSILPIDGYLIFKDKLKFLNTFTNNTLRRLLNVLQYPLFLISLWSGSFNSSNDIIITGAK